MSSADAVPAFRVLGSNPVRPDAVDKVTGRARFAADQFAPGMLYGATVRSPHAHAVVRSIDVSKALAVEGVRAVITGADFPVPETKIIEQGEAGYVDMQDVSDNCIAKGKVFYDGHVVAALAADSQHIANEAARLVEIDYEPCPAVMTVGDAMADGAPIIHETFTPGAFLARTQRVLPNAGGLTLTTGDIDEGFRVSDVIVERTFDTETVHQGYIESHVTTATWGEDGLIEIHTSTQGHFTIRDQVAGILNMPVGKIRVVPLEIGGGFGGKDTAYLDPLAAMLSKRSGRPVRMSMRRDEVLRATGPSSGTRIRVKMGATRDGRLMAADLECAYEAGAFPGGPVGPAIMTATTRYKVPHQKIVGYDVLVNKPKIKPYRAPGAIPANFAVETVIDELAGELRIDPLEFRMRNAMVTGDRMISGLICGEFDGKGLLEAMRQHPHYSAPKPEGIVGRGVAFAFYLHIGMQSDARVAVNADGSVELCTGSCDLSGTRLSLAMQLAEKLGVAVDRISASVAATDAIGFTFTSCGSRTTFATGLAVIRAADKVLAEMCGRAALLWRVDPAKVHFANGGFSCIGSQPPTMSFKELCAKLPETGGTISMSATAASSDIGIQVAGHIVDLAVDVDTGKVQLLRHTAFQDVGRAVHPDLVSGQMQGATAQGVGWALSEEYFYDRAGRLRNATLLDYRMPTALDLPMIETVILETPNPAHPFGVRGAGEASIVPPVAAIANAIYDAVGIRPRSLPMKPGRILEALERKRCELQPGA